MTQQTMPEPTNALESVPERLFEGLAAPKLKSVIVSAALAGRITTTDAEDLISFYGLRHE